MNDLSEPKGNKLGDLNGCPLLASVPVAELRRDCPSARVAALKHRDTIYRQGGTNKEVFCLLKGQVTLARVNQDGSNLTTAALAAGSFFGDALDGSPEADDTAKAKGGVLVWRTPLKEFQVLLLNHPQFALEYIAMLSHRQRQMQRRLEGFAFKRTEVRLAEAFRELSGGFATRCVHGFGRHLRLTQQELADLVGASRPVVSTILNRLRDEGVVGYNREYVCVRGIEDIEIMIQS
ncbi:MAG: Crp/Fnr family transcriptional regulator [Acidobacteriota bacterium]